MATPKGAKFTEEHIAKLVESRKNSKAWREGRQAAAKKLKGRKPGLEAMAGSLATRFIRNRKLTRTSAPTLWECYVEHYLRRLMARQELEAAA